MGGRGQPASASASLYLIFLLSERSAGLTSSVGSKRAFAVTVPASFQQALHKANLTLSYSSRGQRDMGEKGGGSGITLGAWEPEDRDVGAVELPPHWISCCGKQEIKPKPGQAGCALILLFIPV